MPLPSDVSSTGDTYTVQACPDSTDSGICDGAVWAVPLNQDYQNILNSNVVHYGFDRHGVTPPAISGFIAAVALDQAVAQNNLALQPNVEALARRYGFTFSTVGEKGGGPRSSAKFIIVASIKITTANI